MIHKIYSVFDSKVEFFDRPFNVRSRGEAIRMFTDVCNDKGTPIGKNPEDFTLFELGEFDDSAAKYTLHDTPYSVGLAIEFVKSDDVSRKS